MAILPKKKEDIEETIPVQRIPDKPSEDLKSISVTTINRISSQFSHIKNNDKSKVNLQNIRESIEKNIFIKVQESKNKIDEMDYFLENMNKMGKGTSTLLQSLYFDKSKENTRIKKTKNKSKKGKGSAIVSALAISAIVVPLIIAKFNEPKRKIEKKDKEIVAKPKKPITNKDKEIFDLSSADKLALRNLQAKAKSEHNILDMIIRKASGGGIQSLGGLIFGYADFKQSGIYQFFKTNIMTYTQAIVDIFDNIIKTTFKWFKDNMLNAEGTFNNLKAISLEKINKLFGILDDTEEESKIEPIIGAKTSIIGSLKSLVLSFFGKSEDDKRSRVNTESKSKVSKPKPGFFKKLAASVSAAAEAIGINITGDGGNVQIDGAIVASGKVNQLAIFKAFREAGFSSAQAAMLTAEVGRENNYIATTLFGNHKDPARGHNIGFISWQGNRKAGLVQRLQAAGVLRTTKPSVTMDQTYASLLVMAKYVMYEMKTTHNNQYTKKFLANPNITFAEAAPLLGGAGKYIGWARGQTTIRRADGSRKAFDWKRQEAVTAGHYKSLAGKLGQGDEGPTPNIHAENKDNVLASNIDIHKEINTNIRKNAIRSSYTQTNNNHVNVYTEQKTNRVLSTPRNTVGKVMGNVDNMNTSSSSNGSNKITKSFIELLITKDLSGNMLT